MIKNIFFWDRLHFFKFLKKKISDDESFTDAEKVLAYLFKEVAILETWWSNPNLI